MKKLGYVICGIILGFFLNSFLPPKSKPEVTAQAETAPVAVVDKPVKNYRIHQPVVVEPKELPVVAKPRVLELTLNEEVVAELKKNWSDLRNQIQITTEERGFRVSHLSENSIFLQAGLQSGDLISFQTLKTMANSNPEAKQLAGRVVRIFEYVR